MKASKFLLVSIFLIVFLFFSSCDLFNEVTLTINNNSSDSCTGIYIKQVGDLEWGQSIITTDLEPGNNVGKVLTKGRYDLLIGFSASKDTEYPNIDLSHFDTYEFNIVD